MPISIKLEQEIQKELDYLAEQDHSSRSRLIKIAILNYLEENATKTKSKN